MFFSNGLKIDFNFKGILFWVLFIILLLFFTCKELRSEEVGSVDVYYNNEYQLTWTLEEFNTIIKAAKFHSEIIDAEKNERVYIKLEDTIWKLKEKSINEFVTGMEIIWEDEKGNILKLIPIEATITEVKIEETKLGFLRRMYTRIAEIGFPIAILLLIFI